MKQGSKIPLFFRALPQNPMILLERGSRGLAPSQMSAAGEIFQDLRYATLDPTLDQVQPFQNWPWTTLALHRMGDLGPRWATLDRPWTAWSKVGPSRNRSTVSGSRLSILEHRSPMRRYSTQRQS